MKKKSGHRRRTKMVRRSRKNLRRTNKRKSLGKGRRRSTRRYSRIQRGGMTEKELAEAAKVKADSGDKVAQFNLGFMFENGQGVNRDYDIAVYYYTLAANAGHIGAMFRLTDIYRYGREGVGKNEDLAKEYDDKVYAAEAAKKAAEAQAAAAAASKDE